MNLMILIGIFKEYIIRDLAHSALGVVKYFGAVCISR